MIQETYTTNDLIRFIYKETSTKETLLILDELENNWKLKEEYLMLKHSIQQLPKVKFSPSKKSINAILSHSSTTQLETC